MFDLIGTCDKLVLFRNFCRVLWQILEPLVDFAAGKRLLERFVEDYPAETFDFVIHIIKVITIPGLKSL